MTDDVIDLDAFRARARAAKDSEALAVADRVDALGLTVEELQERFDEMSRELKIARGTMFRVTDAALELGDLAAEASSRRRPGGFWIYVAGFAFGVLAHWLVS